MRAKDIQVGGDHYKQMKIQPFEYCMANNLNWAQSSIIKYISRYKSKGGIEDLNKSKHILDMLIEWEKDNGSEEN